MIAYVYGFPGYESPRSNILKKLLRPLYRSSRQEVLLRKGVLKIRSKSTGEHPCRKAISEHLVPRTPSLDDCFYSQHFLRYGKVWKIIGPKFLYLKKIRKGASRRMGQNLQISNETFTKRIFFRKDFTWKF